MMLFTKYSSTLLTLLVLLIIVQECFMNDGGPESGDTTGAPASDPSVPTAGQPAPAKRNKFAGIGQKLTPNKEKWRQRSEEFAEFFKSKPADVTDTLKETKIALIVLYKLLDSKIFDSCANPWSFRINHFDVRNHIFTKQYIPISPFDRTFMNIYHKFLYECCHPLIDMYARRLSDDQTEEHKQGNLMYTPIEIPYQEPEPESAPASEPEPVLKTQDSSKSLNDEHDHQDAVHPPDDKKQASFDHSESTPQSTETSTLAHDPPTETSATPPTQAQAAPRGAKARQMASRATKATRHGLAVGGKKALAYSGKGLWTALKSPSYPYKGAKFVAAGANHQLVKRNLKKGPFKPRALTYWQKAFIYRTVKWAKPFLIVPEYGPSILVARKLDEIQEKYAMNLLDPVFGNLRPRMEYFDCNPTKPSDLENLCIDKDITIEHLYHIADLYGQQKQKKEEEKRERKRLGIKKEKKEKNKAKSNDKIIKFRRKMKKDLSKYGFYPNEPTTKFLALQVIYAFSPEKFEEIFSLKQKEAKKIITKHYRIRKYLERVNKFRTQGIEAGQATNGQVGESKPQTRTSDSSVTEGYVASYQRGVIAKKQANTATWPQRWILQPWSVFTHSITSLFTEKLDWKKKKPTT